MLEVDHVSDDDGVIARVGDVVQLAFEGRDCPFEQRDPVRASMRHGIPGVVGGAQRKAVGQLGLGAAQDVDREAAALQ